MNQKSRIRHRRQLLSGLLLGSLGLANIAQAGCEPTFDPMTGRTGYMGHPCPQTRPGPSRQVEHADGSMEIWTPEGHFPSADPFSNPPGSNFLLTVHENLRDFLGNEMPNTLPSTPTNPYNLHDGPVLTQSINPTNPEEDLDRIIDEIERAARTNGKVDVDLIHLGIDILEGNPIDNRAYSGFPMLHYNGCLKQKTVEPIFDAEGQLVGGNVDVNLIYFGQHIEGDTAFLDPSAVQEVPWTITYHVNILHGGMEDFSPMVMHFDRLLDAEGKEVRGPFHASFDQSFYPMLDEGTRYTVRIKESKGKYYNLTYIWGWRIHPPRVQVIENALKTAPPGPNAKPLPDWECDTFGDPSASREAKLKAIAMIGDLSPAKRMWNLFHTLLEEHDQGHRNLNDGNGILNFARKLAGQRLDIKRSALAQIAPELRTAYQDWKDRTKLPANVEPDPEADLTLLYVNNTLYGSRQGLQGEGSGLGQAGYKGISNGSAHDWNKRPYDYHVTLLNGDHFPHGYMNVDFGGSRGWENQFQLTDPTTLDGPHPDIPPGHPAGDPPFTDPANVVAGEDQVFPINRGGTEEYLQAYPSNLVDPDGSPLLGSGCFFTFGRNYAWPNAGGPWGAFGVKPVAADGTPGRRQVTIHYNFEPSPRLRIYQFDPLHHDVAVYSLH
ncbi:MAG: hypothetical protein Kow0060_12500 [Methylohalobius crimeensis]